MDIPEPVLAADEALYSLLQRVAFSRHLNPSNGREAREAFEAGAHAPPFTYVPLTIQTRCGEHSMMLSRRVTTLQACSSGSAWTAFVAWWTRWTTAPQKLSMP